MNRLETGPHRPDPSDWTGIFIRGDNAFGYAMALRKVLDGTADFTTIPVVVGLYDLLCECIEDPELKQAMKERRKHVQSDTPAAD